MRIVIDLNRCRSGVWNGHFTELSWLLPADERKRFQDRFRLRFTLGHENAGWVNKLGSGTTGFAPTVRERRV
ncbi:hypothetical protein Mycsm_00811 [Mycobacterium sp. JS623]|nr:hypothetical protein Mycsm_00811 [Mycobacterium sp. JS623]